MEREMFVAQEYRGKNQEVQNENIHEHGITTNEHDNG